MLAGYGRGKAVAERYQALGDVMDERVTRLWAGAEALALGRGRVTAVARATGLSRMTVRTGRDEVSGRRPPRELVWVRRKGAGRPPVEVAPPGLTEALEVLVAPVTRGDPESPLRWTCNSTKGLAVELVKQGYEVSPQKVGELLKNQGYSLQAGAKSQEEESCPDRNAQFKHINAHVREFQARGMNWRGRPLEAYETGGPHRHHDYRQGLKVKTRLDRRRYRTGVSVSQSAMHQLRLVSPDFHGDWSCVFNPNLNSFSERALRVENLRLYVHAPRSGQGVVAAR